MTENRNIIDFQVDPVAPASPNPSGWPEISGPAFDPKIHLQIESPATVKDLTFQDFPYPLEGRLPNGIAYTRPFRVLSDEGVKVARAELDKHLKFLGTTTERGTFVRGLGYTSNFHRDFSYSPEVLQVVSSFAGENLQPHVMTSNLSHINIGEIGTGQAVDKWHYDSVEYVLIIILSDMTDMIGGELKVLQRPDPSGNLFDELIQKGIPPELPIETVSYIGAGYGLFMQGSRLLHKVTGVLQANERRISLVNCYQSRNPFAIDRTRYKTHLEDDRLDIVHLEYARHKAFRVSGQLQYILKELKFGTAPEEYAKLLLNAAEELTSAAKLITGEIQQESSWWNEKKDENNEKIAK